MEKGHVPWSNLALKFKVTHEASKPILKWFWQQSEIVQTPGKPRKRATKLKCIKIGVLNTGWFSKQFRKSGPKNHGKGTYSMVNFGPINQSCSWSVQNNSQMVLTTIRDGIMRSQQQGKPAKWATKLKHIKISEMNTGWFSK